MRQTRATSEPRFRLHADLGVAASGAIVAAAAARVGAALSDWRLAEAVTRYGAGQTSEDELNADNRLAMIMTLAHIGLLLVAAVLFITWLRRARENAEFLCDAQHRYGRGWAIGSWFVPVAAFWIPGMIVRDIAVASDPRTPPRGARIDTFRSQKVSLWWTCWMLQAVAGMVAQAKTNNALAGSGLSPASDLRIAASLSVLSAILCCIAAVLALDVIRSINRDQLSRPRIPWWHLT
jgi:hypothetical protein